jgi:PAS domain S-box-containing protein
MADVRITTSSSGGPMLAPTVPATGPSDPYRLVFEHMAAGAARCRLITAGDAVTDVEVLDANRAFEQVRDALPRLRDALSRARASGQAETVELLEDGRALSAVCHPVGRDEAMVVIEDATARRLLAQRAHDLQVRFEQAFHGNAAAMVIAHRGDLRILDVNPRWLELFGATRDEVIGRTAVELGMISEARAAARVAEHREFPGGYDVEIELFTRSGAPLTVLASAKPIDIPEGRCTLTTLIDITARKHAEDAFAVAFNASPAGMLLVEADTGLVVAVNDRMLEMLGDRRDQLIGRCVFDLRLVRQPSNADLIAEIERTGRLSGVEVELACKTGPGVWALASTELVTLHDKRHRLSVFTDITARKQLEASLRELNTDLERRVHERTEALEASNRDLESFSATVSHDLRAPLRAIHGFSEILLEDYATELPDEARGLLTRIHASGDRLRTLIEDLLVFSRVSRDGLRRTRVDLDPLVRAVLEELITGRALGHRLTLRLAPLGSCHADASLLRTVWTNLIDNALKYSQQRERIEIEIGRESVGDEVVYFVRDNGVGFDMADARRLFGAFQRLHADAEFEGTGIGLANVRRIVERHHGRVAAYSEPGRGSRFEFTLGPP